jgi:hypothetical protein
MDIFSQNSRPSFSSSSYQHGFHDSFSAGGGVPLTAVRLPSFMHGHQNTEQPTAHNHHAADNSAADNGDENARLPEHKKPHHSVHLPHHSKSGKQPIQERPH